MITVTAKRDQEYLTIAGGRYRILVDGKKTNGNYAVIEMIIPPGSGPGPHSHADIQETFFIAEGKIEFRTEQGVLQADEGDFVNIPLEGGIHAFKNIYDKEVKLICTVIPAGMDDMFLEINRSSPEQAKGIAEKYGNTLYPNYFKGD